MRILIFLQTLLISITISMAQPSQRAFTSYTSLDGLVHNHIIDIYTDSRGFVWLCTWNGISRFDGYRFRNYGNQPDNLPVQHNRFIKVLEDANGHLWFRTYDGHIYRLNRFTEQFESIDGLVKQLRGKSYKVGHVLVESRGGGVWVEFQGFGLVRFAGAPDPSALKAENYIGHPQVGADIGFIHESADQTIWLVCDGKRVVTLAPGGKTETRLTTPQPIVAGIVAGDGMAYATRHAIHRFADGGTTLLPTVHLSADEITALAAPADGSCLFAGTRRSGIKTLPARAARFEDTLPAGNTPLNIRELKVDSHNTLWITTDEAGITRFDPGRNNYKHFKQKNNTVDHFPDSLTVVLERNDVVWVKMKQTGFGYYNREKDRIEPFYNDASQPDYRMTNGITVFEVDHNNVMWISPYYEKGLMKMVIENAQSHKSPLYNLWKEDRPDEVRALLVDSSNRLWTGTKNGILTCYTNRYERLHTYPGHINGVPVGRIYAIFEDSSHTIWVGTKGDGLWRLTPDGENYRARQYRHSEEDSRSLSDDHVYAITEDAAGHIWIATYEGGINRLADPDNGHFINMYNSFPDYPKEEGARVRYIFSDTPHRMLVGTTEGLIVFNPSVSPEKVKFDLYQRHPGAKNSIGGNDIIHILKDSAGRVWLSTYGGGLSLIKGYTDDNAPVFVNHTTSHGLPGNIVLAATEDAEGNIWLSSDKGIVKFDPVQNIFTSHTQWDNVDSTPYSETSAATDARGNLLFGGMNKLHIIDPDKIKQAANYEYNLTFTSLEVQNREAAIGDGAPLAVAVSEKGTVRLPYDYVLFRIEFASLNYRLQDRVNYMYYLEGYDNDWTLSRDVNSAYYSKVPHGDYTFRVKAFVGNEQMAGPEIAMKIHIATPPWFSWYAYCIYGLLLIAAVWIVLRTLYTMTRLRTEARIEQHMSEMKIKFFTNISHELRTPLTLIIGGIEEVQKRETLSGRAADSLGMSFKNAKRMLALINQLLDFRKIVKDKMELQVRHVDIVPIAQGVLDDFRDMADERKMTLLFTVSHPHIPLWIDTERMESVFYNLLSNAFKFTPDHGTITLSIASKENDDHVLITVSDTGTGIQKEHLNHIFTRFSQYGRSLRGDVSGSGIGLALCKEIVELHHGTLGVESKVTKGTTFTLRLLTGNLHFDMEQIDFGNDENQLLAEAAPADTTAASPVSPPEGAQRILLVDDNAEIRRFIHNNLIGNYRVTEAVDGVDALEKIAADAPDIIVTDIMMPRMDGIELVNRIRNDFKISHIPIIMLTAKKTPEDRLLAMKYGADAYITKPFSIDLLLVRIDNLLTQRRLLFERFSAQTATHRVEDFVPKDVVVTNRDQEFMKTLMKWVDENISNTDLTINDLAGHLGLGRTVLYNKVKALTGKSPIELIKEYRVIKAELLIRSGQFSISEVAYQLGFSDPGYFSRCFKEQYKVSPKAYLRTLNLKGKEDAQEA